MEEYSVNGCWLPYALERTEGQAECETLLFVQVGRKLLSEQQVQWQLKIGRSAITKTITKQFFLNRLYCTIFHQKRGLSLRKANANLRPSKSAAVLNVIATIKNLKPHLD